MGTLIRIAVVVLLCDACCGLWHSARALDGRYIGSFVRLDMPFYEQNRMRHLYDAGTSQVTPGAFDMNLRMSLQYENEPGVRNTDIFRSRFYGDLRGQTWRFHGQFVPWQRTAPGNSIPKRRDLQLGLDWQRRNLPQIRLNITRADRETYRGVTESLDRRAEINYGREALGFNVGVRRLESEPAGPNAARTATDEVRGGLRGMFRSRRFSATGSYNGQFSRYQNRERIRDLNTHRVNLGTTWLAVRHLLLGAQSMSRWGFSDDNAVTTRSDISEVSMSAYAQYTPRRDLSLEATREYRRIKSLSGNVITDYIRIQSLYRQRIVRRMFMQTGFFYAINLQPIAQSAPNSSVFLLVDGELRRNILGRAELRLSKPAQSKVSGTQQRRLLQLRTRPTRRTLLSLLWQSDVLPRFEGQQQHDRVWEFTGGYQPVEKLNLTGSYRLLDGTGRIERDERAWSYNAIWRTSDKTSLGLNGASRWTTLSSNLSKQTTTGLTATWWTAREFKFNVDWRQVTILGAGRSRTYGVTARRNF